MDLRLWCRYVSGFVRRVPLLVVLPIHLLFETARFLRRLLRRKRRRRFVYEFVFAGHVAELLAMQFVDPTLHWRFPLLAWTRDRVNESVRTKTEPFGRGDIELIQPAAFFCLR